MKTSLQYAAVVLCASLTIALGALPIPWSCSFETNTVGTSITNYDGWAGDMAGIGIITNINEYAMQEPAVERPMEGDTHTNVLYFGDMVTGLSNAINGSGEYLVCVDTMIKPMFAETLPSDSNVSNAQIAICFDTNGWLNVYHGFQTNLPASEGVNNHTNGWTILTNGFGKVNSNSWVRLTITMDYACPESYYDMVLFKVMLNGIECSDASGYSTNDIDAFSPSGPWFVAAWWDNSARNISQLVLQGSGMVDDMVITNSPVSVASAGAQFLVVTTGKGSPTNNTAFRIKPTPAYTNLPIYASSFWYITNLYSVIDGVTNPVEQSANGETNTWMYPVSNVNASAYVHVTFAPLLVGDYQTPAEWLSNYGLSTGTDTNDSDSDSMFDWQEYVSGTIPNNSNSLLRILSETVSGGSVQVQWQAAAGADGNARLYSLQSSSNLLDSAAWTAVSNNLTSTGTGTNITTLSAPLTTPALYRVNATNTAPWQ